MPCLNKNNECGFTIIEMVVALAVSMIILGTVVTIFIVQQEAFNKEEQLSDMQQNIRVAIHMISRETRMTGYMVVDTDAVSVMGTETITFLSDIDSDIVTTIDTNPASVGNTSISVGLSDSNDTVATTDYIYISDGTNTELIPADNPAFDLTGEPDTINLSAGLANSYAVGSTVRTIEEITFSHDTIDSELERNNQPIAQDIIGLTFIYRDTNSNVTATAADIREIETLITGRTSAKVDHAADDYKYGTMTSVITPRNLAY